MKIRHFLILIILWNIAIMEACDSNKSPKAVASQATTLLASCEDFESKLSSENTAGLTMALSSGGPFFRKYVQARGNAMDVPQPLLATLATSSLEISNELPMAFIARRPKKMASRVDTIELLSSIVSSTIVYGNSALGQPDSLLDILVELQSTGNSNEGTVSAAALISILEIQASNLMVEELPSNLNVESADYSRSVQKWFHENRRYLYWRPISRNFGLDKDARIAQISSAEYRLTHAWKIGDGPIRQDDSSPTR